MVSFPAVGRMGNFLFELATCIGYSLKHDLDFTVPFTTTDNFWSPIYLTKLQNPNWNPSLEKIDLWESSHGYEELPFDDSWRNKNIIIQGYRQSWRYFDEYRNELIYLFGFPYEEKPICSIHARYGDYLHLRDKHIIINEKYLSDAMALMKEKTGIDRFKVFSDDIKHFQKELGHLYDFEYSTNKDEMSDLVEIACCSHNINSSSTFSWWGSYLNRNENKVVITPQEWFNNGWMGLDTKDIVPESWIKM